MRKWMRPSSIAAGLAVAAVILAVGGLSAPTPVAASQSPSQSGPVTTVAATPGLAKPIVPKVRATYTLNPKAVLISGKDVRFETSKRDIAQQLTYVGTTQISVGSIIVVSTTSGPFYGKVTAISGQLVTTTPATLGDIFKVLNLTMSTPTGSASSRSRATGAVSRSRASGASTRAESAATTTCRGLETAPHQRAQPRIRS